MQKLEQQLQAAQAEQSTIMAKIAELDETLVAIRQERETALVAMIEGGDKKAVASITRMVQEAEERREALTILQNRADTKVKGAQDALTEAQAEQRALRDAYIEQKELEYHNTSGEGLQQRLDTLAAQFVDISRQLGEIAADAFDNPEVHEAMLDFSGRFAEAGGDAGLKQHHPAYIRKPVLVLPAVPAESLGDFIEARRLQQRELFAAEFGK